MKKNNQKLIINIGLILVLSFMLIYAGQFLFSPNNSTPGKADNTLNTPGTSSNSVQPLPVQYKHITETINGYKQEIYILEFDPRDERVEFKPALSFDNIFGFEKLSDICKRNGAYAAVNGGFFYQFGDPTGMVAIDGQMLTASTGLSPIFIVDKKGARFETFYSNIYMEHNRNKININDMNRMGKNNDIVLYNDKFGSTNRAEVNNTSIIVDNNIITAVVEDKKEVNIKKGLYVISFYGDKSSLPEKLGLKAGDKVNIRMEPYLGYGYQAYECGSMLVKDGKSVVPERDKWAGTLGNRDPRTVIGIKTDGKILMLVSDGRQPGYSEGMTGKEMGEYLVRIGVKDAAMLDGGASSQMIINGSLRNRPSYEGIERPVAGCFIVKIK
ncbi:phosphodiester glycosidase family protein [Ruminiclostridium papyrosolvens]|uniref:Exopolysaccharide biosynthesis protein n=1 Tax=Ruminiclostridium papyrosolvens C7 TaxID=1330534 RepID=U4QYS1_9FIRM|nr:phosphodiester glycosidase family protein [Ruminiclostridium papyrosolvens]EPR10100.1 exopolysaccharide biosynthesis protein [Ruminiclostridium papyrosolvens C7]